MQICTGPFPYKYGFYINYDEIKYLLKTVLSGSREHKQLIRVQRAFEKAYKQGANAVDGVKYSLGYTTDNRAVVIIEKDIFNGRFDKLTDAERVKIVKNAIKDFRPGVPISGKLIGVTGKTASHFVGSDYTDSLRNKNLQLYKDKLNISQNIDDVVYAATDYINEGLKHSRKDNITDFARGKVLLDIGGSQYQADVIVGSTAESELLLYDIDNLSSTNFDYKKGRVQPTSAGNESSTEKAVTPSTNSIPQNSDLSTEKVEKVSDGGAKNSLSDPKAVQRRYGDFATPANELRHDSSGKRKFVAPTRADIEAQDAAKKNSGFTAPIGENVQKTQQSGEKKFTAPIGNNVKKGQESSKNESKATENVGSASDMAESKAGRRLEGSALSIVKLSDAKDGRGEYVLYGDNAVKVADAFDFKVEYKKIDGEKVPFAAISQYTVDFLEYNLGCNMTFTEMTSGEKLTSETLNRLQEAAKEAEKKAPEKVSENAEKNQKNTNKSGFTAPIGENVKRVQTGDGERKFTAPIGENVKRTGKNTNPVKTVVLDSQSELYNDVKSSDRSPSAVIRDYIVRCFTGKSITFRDGRTAIVDKTDAKELSKHAGKIKTAEIAKLREIIDNAEVYQADIEADHKKFKSFTYYKATVEMDGKSFDILLNVGFGKFDNQNHFYAITDFNKKRATAGNNSLAGSEDDRLKSGNSNDSITEDEPVVNPEGENISGNGKFIAPTRKDIEAMEAKSKADSGESSSFDKTTIDSFGITKLNDPLNVQKSVYNTLVSEGFFDESGVRVEENTESGMKVEINESGIEEAFSFKNFGKTSKKIKILKLATIRSIPEVIKTGTLTSDNVDNYHSDQSNLKYAYIEKTIDVNGESLTVEVAVRKAPQKNKFWMHKVTIKDSNGSTPAGTSKSSKTGYLTTVADGDIVTQDSEVVKSNSENTSENASNQPVSENIKAKIEALETEIKTNKTLRAQSKADFDSEIAELQAEYDSKRDKNTKVANSIFLFLGMPCRMAMRLVCPSFNNCHVPSYGSAPLLLWCMRVV